MSQEDWLERVQELYALQSICGEDFQYIQAEGFNDESYITRDVEALLEVDPPSGVSLRCQVLVRLKLEASLTVIAGGTEECDGPSICVNHLPPLCLQLLLPPGYPGTLLPEVRVRSTWLGSADLEGLRGELLQLGAAMMELPVLYEWTQWLQDNGLESLGGRNGRLWLRQPCSSGEGEGSSSESRGPDRTEEEWQQELLLQLHTFNIMQEVQSFHLGMWCCGICFEELPGVQCIRLPGCSHFFCLSCMRQHTSINVKEGSLSSLVCPEPGCKQELGPEVLKGLLSPEDFQRWEELTLSRTLDCMSDLVYCPRCRAGCLEDESDHCAECPKCMYVFCGLCFEGWHPGSRCLNTDAKLEHLKKRQAVMGPAGKQQSRDDNAINELKSLKVLRMDSKRCPTCRMGISKTGGCNKMMCTNCSTKFCWKCGKAILGYDHFSPTTCELFDQQEIDEWNHMMVRTCWLPLGCSPLLLGCSAVVYECEMGSATLDLPSLSVCTPSFTPLAAAVTLFGARIGG